MSTVEVLLSPKLSSVLHSASAGLLLAVGLLLLAAGSLLAAGLLLMMTALLLRSHGGSCMGT